MTQDSAPHKFHKILPGIYMLSLPMGDSKGPGPADIYLFTDDPVTLLDTGTYLTLPDLIQALNAFSMPADKIQQIIFTHGHVDHFGGAAGLIKEMSHQPVTAAHMEDVAAIEKMEEIHSRVKFPFLKLMGMPLKYRLGLRLMDKQSGKKFKKCPVTRPLSDGDEIRCGRYSARVIWTPGHSRGSMCLYVEKENLLFSGDTLLSGITPIPIVMLDQKSVIPVRRSQEEFRASMDRLEKLTPDMILPGHGPLFRDIKAVTGSYRKHLASREEKILKVLNDGPATVHEIAVKVFPVQPEKLTRQSFKIFLAISEVFTHLQVMAGETVCAEKKGGVYIIRRKQNRFRK